MKSSSLARLWYSAVLLAACCVLLPMASKAPAATRDYTAHQAKPPERCVPRHIYAAEQPECWRQLP